jgi:hypothetical protein
VWEKKTKKKGKGEKGKRKGIGGYWCLRFSTGTDQ